MDPETAQVKAAGCVVWRPAPGAGIEIALVHRPRYDDWSLPKGKLDRGESWEGAAVREVEEETGLRGELGAELEPVFYRDRKKRRKAVRYWLLESAGPQDDFAPNAEVDELRWVTPDQALKDLTYPVDRETVRRAVEALRP